MEDVNILKPSTVRYGCYAFLSFCVIYITTKTGVYFDGLAVVYEGVVELASGSESARTIVEAGGVVVC